MANEMMPVPVLHRRDTTEIEYLVVGVLLQKPEMVRKIAELVEKDDFSLSVCGAVFERCLQDTRAGRHFDIASGVEAIKDMVAEPLQFLRQCAEITTTTANAELHAQMIRKAAENERFYERVTEALNNEEDPQAAVAAICHQKMRQRRGTRLKTMADAMREAMENIAGKKEGRIDTGFPLLDATLKGLWPGQLILIGARPGCGKSAMCMEIAESAAIKGKTVLHITAEMMAGEVGERLIAKRANGLTMDQLIDGVPDDERIWSRIVETAGWESKLPVYFYDGPDVTVSRIRELALGIENLGMIVVDYLGLMIGEKDKRAENRNLELGGISRELKLLASELEIPVLAAAQLSRTVNETDKPRLSSLRDSGELEQNAVKVIFLWKTSPGDDSQVGCTVAKNRRGRTGDVNFYFDGSKMTFTELSRRTDDEEPVDKFHRRPRRRRLEMGSVDEE